MREHREDLWRLFYKTTGLYLQFLVSNEILVGICIIPSLNIYKNELLH